MNMVCSSRGHSFLYNEQNTFYCDSCLSRALQNVTQSQAFDRESPEPFPRSPLGRSNRGLDRGVTKHSRDREGDRRVSRRGKVTFVVE